MNDKPMNATMLERADMRANTYAAAYVRDALPEFYRTLQLRALADLRAEARTRMSELRAARAAAS